MTIQRERHKARFLVATIIQAISKEFSIGGFLTYIVEKS
jgi:hypothetical protein